MTDHGIPERRSRRPLGRDLALDRARVGKCEVLEAGTAWDFNSNTLMATTRRLGYCKGYTYVYGQVV